MYGKNKYGLIQFASDSGQDGGQTDYYTDLMQYVPPFVAEKTEMNKLYISQGYEAGLARHNLEDLLKQCFVLSATWGLIRWEEVFGITPNLSLSYEQRREIVLAKMRGQGTTTVEMIRSVAEAFSGGEVEVIEDNPHYRFIVRFVGIMGIPRNMQAFKNMLEEIKPAHLGYAFEYKWVIWNDLLPYVWNELRPYTWDGLRVMEITAFVSWNGLLEEEYTWNGLSALGWQDVKKIEEAKRICN